MTPDEYREALSGLGLTIVGASKLLGVDARTSRRWARGERSVPPTVAVLIRMFQRDPNILQMMKEAKDDQDLRRGGEAPV